MRVIVQRVIEASVTLPQEGDISGHIDQGLLAMVGLQRDDTDASLDWMVEKLIHLRIFPDENGKMNLSIKELEAASVLLIPNFTVGCHVGKGRRPSFDGALPPDAADVMFSRFVEKFSQKFARVQTGRFGAHMLIRSCNDGPITFVIESQAQ